MCKCGFGDGVVFKPDGVNEVDPCLYEETERHYNCCVVVSRCVYCGDIDISWLPNNGRGTDYSDEEK